MKKIPTIFNRDTKNRSLVTQEINPLCKWVFEEPSKVTPRQKYDGTCCKVDEQGFWKRRTVKPGKNAPKDFVQVDIDSVTGKKFGWVKVDPLDKGDRFHIEAYNKLKSLVKELHFGTYELIGESVQGNPERRTGHILLPHCSTPIFCLNNFSFDAIKAFLEDINVEGIIFYHEDGRLAKIKKSDFGLSRVPETLEVNG